MSHVPIARLAMAALALHSSSVVAAPVALDLRAAIERAHRTSPTAIAARGHVAEAQAGLVGAEVWFAGNPELEGGAGPRLSPGGSIDAEARLEQGLEPGRRGPRRQRARAELHHAAALADGELRALDLEVSLAFYDAVFAEQAAALARRAQELAQRAAAVAERRRRAGDITDLDTNLARLASGRASAAVQAAAAERALAIGRLAALTGVAPGDSVALVGEFEAGAPDPAIAPGAIAGRADVRALDAEGEVAQAQAAQAAASAGPEVAAWIAYHREDATDIMLGGLRVALPLWNRAQGERAAAVARERRAAQTREAILRVADRQVADALAVYASAREASETFEREVVPAIDDSERLLQQTVDAGQIAIPAYLVARQELLTSRREHLERRLALARAAAGVRFALGVAP